MTMSCCIRLSIKSSVFYQRRCTDTVYEQSVWQTEVSCLVNPKTTDAEHLWSWLPTSAKNHPKLRYWDFKHDEEKWR